MNSIVRPVVRRVVCLPVRDVVRNAGADALSTLRARLSSTTLVRGVDTFQPPVMAAGEALIFNSHSVWEVRQQQQLPTYGQRTVTNLIPAAGSGSASLAVAANKTMTLVVGIYIFSMGAGTGTATFSGTGGATGTLVADASDRTTVTKTITAGTLIVTASVATLVDLQVEFSTPRADTTTPSSYVSIGVLSPPFHGANVDGVAIFETLNGNGVDGSTVIEAVGAAIDPDDLKGYFSEGATEEISGRSANLTDANWAGPAQVAQDAVGLTGVPNEDFTLTDSSNTVREFKAFGTTIVSGSSTYFFMSRIRFDSSPTVFPRISMFLNGGGTPLDQGLILDPSDGSFVVAGFSSGVVISIQRVENHFFVLQSITDNSSGNDNITMNITPAWNADGTATGDVTAQGSTVFATCELYKDTRSHSPIKTTGGTPATRPASIEPVLDAANYATTHSGEFDLTSFSDAARTSPEMILDFGSGKGVRYGTAAKSIELHDGTNTVTITNAFDLGETVHIKYYLDAATSLMNISADRVKGVASSYVDITVTEATWLSIALGAAVKDDFSYSTALGDSWLQSSI